jgi:hypothetical protein
MALIAAFFAFGDSRTYKIVPMALIAAFFLFACSSDMSVTHIDVALLTKPASDSRVTLPVSTLTYQHLSAAAEKLLAQLNETQQLQDFRKVLVDRMKVENTSVSKLYFDFGLSMGLDTDVYLGKGYSVVSVDAFLPWVEKAREKNSKFLYSDHKLIVFNVGVTDPTAPDFNADGMPLYFVKEGDVRASFMREKGCLGHPVGSRRCKHVIVPTVPCESILQLIGTGGGTTSDTTPVRAEILKVDIEMMHHTCLRALQNLDANLLPKYVCWEEHDKDFGTARMKAPMMDTKLMLLLYELGYDGVKIIMQGPYAPRFYSFTGNQAGGGSFSGDIHPEEMFHYRSYEQHGVTTVEGGGQKLVFDADWRSVSDVLTEGIFGRGQPVPGTNLPKMRHFHRPTTYYDFCMKLNLENPMGTIRQRPENFPISRTQANSHLFS